MKLLEHVHAGQELGHLCDLHGQTIEVFRAPCDGLVAMLREFPVVEPGEPLFLLAEEVRK